MKNKLTYSFEEHLNESLKDKTFQKEWNQTEPEYTLACKLIEKRIQKKLSQRELAKKVHTSQAVISRLETMQANPSLALLKRIAEQLGTKIQLRFQ